MLKKSVVVLGGGTGTHTVLRGLKRYQDRLDITAIVSMADSGGSTGRLRDEFGMLPVGDVRMALAALADENETHELLMRELFLYRFNRGEGLSGHNLGNLLLTALTSILGSEAEAVSAASGILRVKGRVLPVTTDDIQLSAIYDDGKEVVGEHLIDDPAKDRSGRHIKLLGAKPVGKINPEAHEALVTADLIIIGPGDLYSSLLANCVIQGVPEAIKQSRSKLTYIANLMERFGQTEGMTARDCILELDRYVGRMPDIVLINNSPISPDILAYYQAKEGTKPVIDDLDTGSLVDRVVRADLISSEILSQSENDTVKRSLVRHDSDKLARTIVELLE